MENARNAEDINSEQDGIVGFARQAIQIVTEQQIPGFAQMIAYNLLFATAPFLMVITAGAAAITRAVNADMENPAEPVLQWMQETLPQDTAAFLQDPIERAVNADTGWIFSVGALLALWGARGAIAAVIRGLNVAYGIGKDPRSFLQQNLRAIGLTILLVLLLSFGGFVFTLGTDVGDRIASAIGLGDLWNNVSFLVRWPLIVVISVIAVMTLHRYGPAVKSPFKWYLPGSLFSVIGMYLATLALGLWFSMSGGFMETYGIFGSVLAFVFWLHLMGVVILLGGVINAVVHQRFSVKEEAQA